MPGLPFDNIFFKEKNQANCTSPVDQLVHTTSLFCKMQDQMSLFESYPQYETIACLDLWMAALPLNITTCSCSLV